MAAVLQALRRFLPMLRNHEISCIALFTDNAVVEYGLRKWKAALPLRSMVRKIYEFLQREDIQLTTTHLPGKDNTTADSLSRLARSGDYALKREIALETMEKLKLTCNLDAFASRTNKLLKNYCSV
jgi:ribonuclease HI